MASHRFIVLTAVLALGASGAAAQTPEPTPEQTAVACAPPVLASTPSSAPHIIGSQDVVARSLFGTPEQLVISGGTESGVQLGQQYFTRRIVQGLETSRSKAAHLVRTSGWGRVVAVNATTAIVNVEHACAEILEGDYLDAFQIPELPAGDIAAVDTTGEPDFSSYGRVLYGTDQRNMGGTGEFMLIDRGSEQSIALGARFAIYRDLNVGGVPLTSIGEAMVVSVGPSMALVRINRSRDAILSGDLVVPRSK